MTDSVKDGEGLTRDEDYGRCQTGEIKGCLDLVILFMQKFRQIPRKNIGRDNRQQAVVGEADAEAHQKKSGEKADHIQRQNIGSRVTQVLCTSIIFPNPMPTTKENR